MCVCVSINAVVMVTLREGAGWQVQYLAYNRLPLRWRVLASYTSHLILVLSAVIIRECVSAE